MAGSFFLPSLEFASARSAEEAVADAVDATEEDRSPAALAAVGGVSLRVGGSLEPVGERSFFSRLCCGASGGERSLRAELQLKASCRSAATLLLEILMFWPDKAKVKVNSIAHSEKYDSVVLFPSRFFIP